MNLSNWLDKEVLGLGGRTDRELNSEEEKRGSLLNPDISISAQAKSSSSTRFVH